MSTINASTAESVFKFDRFLGLNENPDGDTKLKHGEASVCRNWKVTRDGNLQRRPGSKTMCDLGTKAPVMGIWYGLIKGREYLLAASGNALYSIEDGNARWLGKMDTSRRVNFFPFSGIVYILNGSEYLQYDGIALKHVVGYRPLIITGRYPDGSKGELLEEINKLTGRRRVWFSPDGKENVFKLPEQDLLSIDYVMNTATGTYTPPEQYVCNVHEGTVTFSYTETFAGDGTTTVFECSVDNVTSVTVTVDGTATETTFENGKITFTEAPAEGKVVLVVEKIVPPEALDSIEIGYTAVNTLRTEVSKMTNAELFLGAQDNAVFLYGNGTNEAFYSSVDYWGQPRADYFPDLNEVAVADSNTPITAMIRHYSQLLCFKSDSSYVIHFGTITLANGSQEWGFYVTPVNRSIGNEALGQARLVLNSPYTVFGSDLYEWKNTSSYSSNLTVDERQAKRISDRIHATLDSFKASDVYAYDDNYNQEYYLVYGNKALVQNYAADAWYLYEGLDINCMCNVEEDAWFGTSNGRVKRLAYEYRTDDGEKIEAYWESGSVDFGMNYMRKMTSNMWVGIKPETAGEVYVTLQTDKKSEYTEKVVSSELFSFANFSFARLSFRTNRKPQMKKLKIKAKKFVFLKLIFKSGDTNTAATVLAADIRVRSTGYAK